MQIRKALAVFLVTLCSAQLAQANLIPTSSPLFNREVRCEGKVTVYDVYSGVLIPLEIVLFSRDGNTFMRGMSIRISGGGGGEQINSQMSTDAIQSNNRSGFSSMNVETVAYSTDDRKVHLFAERENSNTAWRFATVIKSRRYGNFVSQLTCVVL